MMPARAHPESYLRLAAGRRLGTLRARVMVLSQYQAWLESVYGVRIPTSAAHVSSYLDLRSEENVTRSKLRGVFASIAFWEVLAGLPAAARVTSDVMVLNFYKEALTRVTMTREPRVAPRPVLVLMAALEGYVMSPKRPPLLQGLRLVGPGQVLGYAPAL